MKPRRVMLTLEVDTDAPLPVLRKAAAYVPIEVYGGYGGKGAAWTASGAAWTLPVQQAQANVVKPAPKKARKRQPSKLRIGR